MSLIVLLTLGAMISHATLAVRQAPPGNFTNLRLQAERFITDGSYAKANALYQQAASMDLPPAEKRWVAFRTADTSWRSQAGTQTVDSTIYDEARKQLEELIRVVERDEDRDLVWADAHESLGDFFWARRDSQDWGNAWPHYQAALDWWAGSQNIDHARDRYLNIVWKMSEPSWMERTYYNYGANVPLDVLDNALKIAQSENDKAHAHYLIALMLRNQGGDWGKLLRIPREFDGAIAPGKTVEWYDDALYAYGEWLMNTGRPRLLENGQWIQEQDYPKALEMFQRLVREFNKGESRYYDPAKQQIENITRPVVNVGVSNIFLPKSEVQYSLGWRNVKRLDLTLYQVELTKAPQFSGKQANINNWINDVDLSAAEKIKSWTKDTQDKGDYKPGQSVERFDEPLAVGAYIIEAVAGDQKARDLILITEAAVVLKTAGDQALAFVCNAVNSAPMANAQVRLWRLTYGNNNRWISHDATRQTNAEGLCVFGKDDFPKVGENSQYFVTIAAGDHQAFAWSNSNWYHTNHEAWKIYAFTDRPAYRPGDTVQWKLTARTWTTAGYATPANQSIEYEMTSPRGEKVSAGTASLNSFGSAWGSVELTDTMPLGEYRVTYWSDKERKHGIGDATLFRLEEYKLPEFQVAVKTPMDEGKRKAFRLGEKVDVDIQADYYFGGPVANASVEVVVHQNPYYRWWEKPRDFPWCYEESNPYRWWGGGEGQIVKRETIKTDAQGKAKLSFDTPGDSQQDLQYRIEARVTDASRREITGSDSVRVTRQRYYVQATPQHNIYRPQDKVEIDIKAMDANDQPVQTEGIVKITREQWREIWLDSNGAEVFGEKLAKLQQQPVFPPPPDAAGRPWRMKLQGYESEDILTTTVKLNEKGEGSVTFTPAREGYYKMFWRSDDPVPDADGSLPITTETYVWVATNASSELGYRYGGLQLVIDKDTFRVGQKAPVMVVTPTNDRWVLFTVGGNDLYSYQVVHVTGSVKLVEVPIDQRHVPNVWLSASMAHDAQLFEDTKEVIVPPVEQYLDISVTADRPNYQPGEEGTFIVTAKDHDGKPVMAEIALAVADEAVQYIQQDYAGDPRQFFFDQRQGQYVQGGSTFQQKAFVRLIKGMKDRLIDERLKDQLSMDESRMDRDGGWDLKDAAGDKMNMPGQRQRSFGLAFASGRSGGGAFGEPASVSAEFAGDDSRVQLGKELAMKSEGKAMNVDGMPGGAGQGPEGPAVVVRSDFRATLFWKPDLITDEDGTANVKLKYGDSLTSWKSTARAATSGNQFGIGSITTRTRMPLIARLQAPRFFLVGDLVTISGVINNNTDERQSVTPELVADGLTIQAIMKDGQPLKDGPVMQHQQPGPLRAGVIEIAPNSEVRIEWKMAVESLGRGEAKIKLTAKSDKYSDAMEKTYPIYEHGIEKFIAKSGKVRAPGSDVTIQLDIPKERKAESTTLSVQVTPSMAVTMLDALPYLIDYPYGCTEQTMSRFLPAAITSKTLTDLGIKPETVMNKVFGGIEQKHVAKTQPKGKKDLNQLQEITNLSLERLYDFQHADGGWGWWKEGESDHFMTAYVLWGLCLAKQANLDVREEPIARAAEFLNREIVEEETRPDMQAWLLHALATQHQLAKRSNLEAFQRKAFDNLWTKRDKLNAYTRALVALSAHMYGDHERAKTLVGNLENGVKRDDRPDVSVIVKGVQGPNDAVIGTAHWGEDGLWWRWSDGGVEATAFALRAMLAIDPQNKLIEPVTNWLIKNRRGAQWSNTRDTAIVVLAMNDYLKVSGELKPELEYELQVNGHTIATRKVSGDDVLAAPSRFEINREFIKNGLNDIRIIRKGGGGAIYFAADAKFYSLEEPIPAAGNEIFVRREYYKLVPRPTLLMGVVYDRVPVPDNEAVESGERVEVVLTIEAKNNYEYLVFEDLKPAGLEAVAVRSGEPMYTKEMKSGAVRRTFGEGNKSGAAVMNEQATSDAADYTGRSRWVYQELRDRKVAMFIDHLPEGVWELRYDLRAEVPGKFHALPVLGHAMYVPEIRCNSAEVRFNVMDSDH